MSEIFTDQSKLTVHYNQKPCYDIVIQEDFSMLADACAPFLEGGRKVCIVSDSHVAQHYLEEVKNALKQQCFAVTTFVFTAGEEQKNLDTVKALYEHLILNHFERRDLLVALGGGVVGDLTGYTAATYLRGIDFIQVPTSLLAQVDSSVGGKTGVDFDSYKNMVGAFHMPKLVYINTGTLKTLSTRQYLSGMGEVIKYGIIFDAPFFKWIQDNQEGIKQLAPNLLREMIYRSCDNKRKVVEEDPTEQGRRALLNYGHTLGHAIEKLTKFQYLHGECVAVGSILSARIAFSKGLIAKEVLDEIEQLIADFSFPAIREYQADEVVETVKSDKKMSAGQIKFIILDEIGHAYITKDVTDADMKMVLEAYHAES
jgi:3-dehydroquinate synthase